MIDVKKTFLKLTTKLYPYGTEDEIIRKITQSEIIVNNLKNDVKKDNI